MTTKGQGQHVCDVCAYKASCSSNLKTHVKRVHDRRKAHQCQKCEYFTGNRHHLLEHINAVHDKINYKCTNCEYSGSRRGLAKHIKHVHDKIKDHHCVRCNYVTSYVTRITCHMKNVHKEVEDKTGEFK